MTASKRRISMKLHDFFKALEEMQRSTKDLRCAMRTYFPWCEDAVRGTREVATTKERAVLAGLNVIGLRLDRLLEQYDQACAATNLPQRYAGYCNAALDLQ